jgi:hypothetical protein
MAQHVELRPVEEALARAAPACQRQLGAAKRPELVEEARDVQTGTLANPAYAPVRSPGKGQKPSPIGLRGERIAAR